MHSPIATDLDARAARLGMRGEPSKDLAPSCAVATASTSSFTITMRRRHHSPPSWSASITTGAPGRMQAQARTQGVFGRPWCRRERFGTASRGHRRSHVQPLARVRKASSSSSHVTSSEQTGSEVRRPTFGRRGSAPRCEDSQPFLLCRQRTRVGAEHHAPCPTRDLPLIPGQQP